MSATAEAFEYGFDAPELFDEFELNEAAIRGRFRPGKTVNFPGSVSSATLNTPKGPATLNLPAPVATLAQFRALEQTVNGNTQRLNAVQTALARITRDVSLRRNDQQSQGTTMMLFSLLSLRRVRDDLAGHTHNATTGAAVLPQGTGSTLTSMLPLILLMQPNALGGNPGSQDGAMGGISPLLLLALFN
jgi:hypothetical protein